jgi:acetyl-CoA carboxylase biotin carboxylase subunit
MFDRILIANRGEIALRIARACRELGVSTVAVYSTEDRDSAVVRSADSAVCIGAAAPRDSYLNAAAIVEAALQQGAEAVHPGCGFLSEDAEFAEVCADNGLVFIGPPPSVLAAVGDKSTTRQLMAAAGMPVLPGSSGPVSSVAAAERIATQIGYPVIVKAAAGGGGMGMQVAWDRAELTRKYQETRAYAQAMFGNGAVYVEAFMQRVRHVEVQVLCDSFGGAVSLGERDCTVQRRRQKLIEETPAPGLPRSLVTAMSEAAVRSAQAIGYVGAGTFEFLVDERGAFHFLEVNGRLQVEHGVTEMATGIDIVQQQIMIAAGAPLPLRQADVSTSGVVIECRVNAEDAERGFVPTPGVLERFVPPAGPFVRVDTHGYPGWRMSPSYDSLLAKVLVWAPDRPAAIRRMERALAEFDVAGPRVRTTIDVLRSVLADPLFGSALHTTGLLAPAEPDPADRQAG